MNSILSELLAVKKDFIEYIRLRKENAWMAKYNLWMDHLDTSQLELHELLELTQDHNLILAKAKAGEEFIDLIKYRFKWWKRRQREIEQRHRYS